MKSNLSYKWIGKLEDFAALRLAVCSLQYDVRHLSPHSTFDWLYSWWNAFASSYDQLALCAVFADDRLIGLAPFYERKIERCGMRLSVLRLLGDEYVGASEIDILTAANFEEEVLDQLSVALSNRSFAMLRWNNLKQGALLARLLSFFPHAQVIPTEKVGTIVLPPSVDAFWAGLSKNKRKELRRKRRQLESRGSLRMLTSTAANFEARKILYELNAKRLRTLGVAGGFQNSDLRRFGDLTAGSSQIKSQVFCLWIDQTPIAALLIHAGARAWFAYQTGIDPDWERYSPGNVLDIMAFEYAIAHGIKHYDFGPGDQAYKLRFGANFSQRYQATWFRRRSLVLAWQLKTALNPLIGSLRGVK